MADDRFVTETQMGTVLSLIQQVYSADAQQGKLERWEGLPDNNFEVEGGGTRLTGRVMFKTDEMERAEPIDCRCIFKTAELMPGRGERMFLTHVWLGEGEGKWEYHRDDAYEEPDDDPKD